MYLRTILIVLVLAAVGLFTAANWQAITTPTTLSLIFTEIEAPLGLFLIGMVIVLAALFLFYVVYLQSSVLWEGRRHARELHAQRELAEHSETSRIHELRAFLEGQLNALTQGNEASRSELAARLDHLERDLRRSIEQCQSSLTASLAAMDHRVKYDATESSARTLA